MATGAETKVENGNASAVVVDYTAYAPPPAPREKPKPAGAAGADDGLLPPARAEMHKKVLGHFRSESYKLPGVKEEEDGELRDEEKFWLVRVFFIFFSSFFCFLLVDDWSWSWSCLFFLGSLMIACCGKEDLCLNSPLASFATNRVATRVHLHIFANAFFFFCFLGI
jgi:hypothetical protein